MGRCAFFITLIGACLLVGCKQKPTEVEIDETREISGLDKPPKLNPTSGEQFEGTSSTGSVRGSIPKGWQRVEGSSMRVLNFSFGPNGLGEVYLSKSRGDVPANVARWLRQFGETEFDPEKVKSMPQINLGPLPGVLVEAEGTYSPGMGRPAKENQALVGAIAAKEGVIWTLKMTGPKELVTAEKSSFMVFCQTLELPE